MARLVYRAVNRSGYCPHCIDPMLLVDIIAEPAISTAYSNAECQVEGLVEPIVLGLSATKSL